MNRQRIFKLFCTITFSVFLLSCSKSNPKKPNILFISVDDLNDWIGVLGGHPQVKTPNLNKLFSESGIYFSNAHAAQPVCTASRASLLSGIHPSNSGWYANTTNMAKNYDTVMRDHKMLPQYLKSIGYKTFSVGKVFHSGESDFKNHTDEYWSEYAPHFWNNMADKIKETGRGYRGHMFYPFPKDGGQLVQSYGEDTINNYYRSRNRFYSLCGGPLSDEEIPKEGMYDEQIANWAINKLDEEQKDPFFMAVGFIRPHVPYTAPQKYFDLYDREQLIIPQIPDNEMADIPLMGKAIAYGYTPKGDWQDVADVDGFRRDLVHSYLACISFVDDQIGTVIDALENSKHKDNTIIVLWSDHGQHLGEKRHFRKQALWEEATKSVLYFKSPNINSKGNCKEPVSLLDIYPTLVDLIGNEKNDKLDGNSILPLIKNPNTKWSQPVLTSWGYKNYAIRSKNWRYIQYRDGSEELYDHKNDPNEHTNLAGLSEYREVIEGHKKHIPVYSALPAGTAVWKGDKYDKLIKQWEKDGVPEWLQ
jgi:iduronate 2-sulfatase